MKNSFYSAKLTSWDEITIVSFSDRPMERLRFEIYCGDQRIDASLSKSNSLHGLTYSTLKLTHELELGFDYIVQSNTFGSTHLNVANAALFTDFDERFAYDGDDLGATYTKSLTKFALWAPLASTVLLKYKVESGGFRYEEMRRTDRGVYRHELKMDCDGLQYSYIVYNNGYAQESLDPYAKSGTANSKMSYVIDLEKTKIDLFIDKLPVFEKKMMSIYECSVRDMTSHDNSGVAHKGQFLGLTERGTKTKKGLSTGLDYLSSLGVSHIQLLPVLDFGSVDELHPKDGYNWGYDPMQFFVLEGSYATNPDDPYARIKEFKKMIREFHKSGLRVVLDVVYNHVYHVATSCFTRTVPEYYFRHLEDGHLANCSCCGDDFASERAMARKIIIDSLCYLTKEFAIDGFRFDLMGLIDAETINQAYIKVKRINPDSVFYGEGWSMNGETFDGSPLMTMDIAKEYPDIGFFNDRYRDITRGRGSQTKLEENGFLLGNDDFMSGFEFIMSGSCLDITYPALFNNPKQSINFVECHDNATLFDVLSDSLEEDEKIYDRLLLINKAIMLSVGIPFIHMGQEIGQTKKGHTNTFNEGDSFNQFDYNLLDSKEYFYNAFRAYVIMRRDLFIANLNDNLELENHLEYLLLDDMLVNHYFTKRGHIVTFFNTKEEVIYYSLKEDQFIYCPHLEAKEPPLLTVHNAMLPPISATVFIKKSAKRE